VAERQVDFSADNVIARPYSAGSNDVFVGFSTLLSKHETQIEVVFAFGPVAGLGWSLCCNIMEALTKMVNSLQQLTVWILPVQVSRRLGSR
jgi:hypothetical protein